MTNEHVGSPIRSDNVDFANNEQASLVFFIAFAKHNLILRQDLWTTCYEPQVLNTLPLSKEDLSVMLWCSFISTTQLY